MLNRITRYQKRNRNVCRLASRLSNIKFDRTILADPAYSDTQHQDLFSIVSYNIMCDSYHDLVPKDELKMVKDRDKHLYHELSYYNSDIMCLQEVESTKYNVFWKPMLEQLGYNNYYQEKPATYRATKEGCATFFKKSKYELLDAKKYILHNLLYKFKLEIPTMIHRKLLGRDHILTCVLLKERSTDRILCVANTHLYLDDLMNFYQTKLALIGLTDFLHQEKYTPILYCGDFNFRTKQKAYTLMRTGSVSMKGIQEPIHHNFDLESVYQSSLNREIATDYIWYSKPDFAPAKVMETPERGNRILSKQYPSDHYALFSQMAWI
eukprot:TRINITY_DN5936_c0_g1_i2.p1 TRINITY_DN5936_c0_g1~~TRINITY_DN5936_c0_g1_i2.p1  ORF type:complete len:323 (+),score=29.87 TRINITY_DN5936_c0_g1_i2:43-1011(+)